LDDRSAESILAALTTLVYLDRSGRAAAWCDTLLGPDAAERLAPTWQALFAAIRAEAAVRRGDLAAADRYACAALTEISPQSWGVAIGAPLSALLAASVDMGRYREAGDQLAQPVPDALLQTTFGLHYLHARGRYALAVDLPHAALADFQACGDLMARWGVTSPAVVPWRTDAAYALLRVGEAREARDLIQRQLRATRDGFPRARGAALRALAQTTDLRQRRNILREAVDVLQTCGDDLELARALADLSRTHYALGESNTARLMLRRAHHLSQECQAEPLRRSLQPSQAEPSGEPGLAGVDGDSAQQLSDAERRVAVLAAQGHTNREIARRLYITISTVEQHLTRIYRKLNVNRRADLPTGLQAAPAATAGYPDPASRCGPDLVQSRP
jgi:DNA-binding CsgD family transcriptional regulator